jgi:hypothetical protein
MKCQQRLTHAPVAAVGQIFERHLNVLAKDAPLLTEEIGDRGTLAVLDPTAPIPARVLDCLGPVGEAIGGHVASPGGENTKRYACVWSSITSVRANKSGGHSRTSSVIWHPPKASHIDAGVGSPEPGQDDETADAVLLIDAPWFVIITEARCIERSAVSARCDQHH